MIRLLITITALLLIQNTVTAQKEYLIGVNITVFYPADFDSAGNLPSFALVAEPPVLGDAPLSQAITPEFYKANGKACARIAYDGNADLYGTGEGIGTMRRNGLTVTFWNTDNFNYNTDNGRRLYQSHPWILGVRADGSSFGILIDNTWKHTLTLNNPIEIISDGPSFRIIVIERPSPEGVIKALATLTGKMDLPPLWTLGYQQSRYSYLTETRVKEIANTFRSKKIPCDVIWMDIDYMQDFKVFTFNNTRFPDPAGLNSYLHDNKFRSIWMIDPGIKKQNGYFVYDQGKAGNHWVQDANGQEYNGNVWPGSCAFPDFTQPSTQAWWGGLYHDFMATGMDGVWNDMNEPSVFNGPGGTMPATNLHRGGGPLPAGSHLRYHNVYGMLMVRSSREGILNANPTKRPFVLSRSNFLGGQRYAATWTGDNVSSMAHLKLSIPMSINLGLSGQPFSGPDIGGYSGNATADLLANWMAVGAFYPFCRNHSSTGTNDQEPWALGTTTENVSRTALERRYKLLPFLYTLFHEAATTGMPVMRPVFMSDPTDLSLRTEQTAFMWGKELVIVPKWADNPVLPKGIWKTIAVVGEDSKTDQYQPDLLLKGGAIIPVGQLIQSTAEYSTDSLTLLIALDSNKNANGQVYVDSGDGFGYRNNEYLLTQFTATKLTEDSILVTCTSIDGAMQIDRTYRGGLVTNNGTFYSNWTTDSSFVIYIPKEMSLTLVTPANNMLFAENANVPIKVDNNSVAAIAKVEYYYDDVYKLGESTQPPYEFNWANVPTGVYTITAKAYSSDGLTYITNKSKIQVGSFGSGKILRQVWDSLPGYTVADLTNSPNFPATPSSENFETSFAGPTNVGDHYGSRLVGYIHPPKTGDYTFWIAGDDYCSLYLSTDTTDINKRKIAEVPGWTDPESWDKYIAQKSITIQLEAGKKYYVEALHKENTYGDNVAVAWEYTGQSREVIPGSFLSPFVPKTIPPVVDPGEPTFTWYPNPANDKVTIKLPAGTEGKMVLVDVWGRILLNKHFTTTTTTLSFTISGFSQGVYFIRMETVLTKKVQKLIIERR